MISTRRAIVRLVGATAAGLALLAPLLIAPLASAEVMNPALTLADPAQTTGLELRLARVSPGAVRPTDELVVTGTAHNLGSTPVRNAKLSLWLRSAVLPDRASINTWLDEGVLTTADAKLTTASIASLAPGASVTFSLKVAPGATGLFSGSSFGPRPIAVDARAGGRRLGSLRSTIVWAPTEITTRTRLSVIVPITSTTPSTHAGEATADAAAALSSGGRLQRLLAASSERAMAWAVDPAILASADRLVTDGVDEKADDADLTKVPGADPSSTNSAGAATTGPAATGPTRTANGEINDAAARTAAQDWLTVFKAEQRKRGVFALPYGDLDLTSVLKTGKGRSLLKTADELGRTVTEKALGAPLDTALAWPADGRINAATTRSLARNKRTSVILASRAQKLNPPVEYTPTGHSTVGTGKQTLDGLLYDEQLSALLSSDAPQTPAATQTLLAQLAAITMERPDTVRHVLAVTPRNWDPNPAAVKTMMDALGTAPWINLRGIDELKQAPTLPRNAPSYGKNALARELPIGTVSGATVLDQSLKNFAPILADPKTVQPLQERVISLLSVAWRSVARRQDREELVSARQDVAKDVNGLVGGVQLVTQSAFFTARKSPFPVTVRNTTDYEVTVLVRLKPQSGQLTFDPPVPVTVAPNTRTPVFPLARALASGDVVVEAKLLSVDGVALGPGQTFTVRVRPEWEGRGMMVIGSILGLMLVIGLLRGIRRNRTRVKVPIEAVPDIDELATQRAGFDPGSPGSGSDPDSGPGSGPGSGYGGGSGSGSGAGNGSGRGRGEPVSVSAAGPMAAQSSSSRAVNSPLPSVVPTPQLAPVPGATLSVRRPPTPMPPPIPESDGEPVTGPMSLPMLDPEPDPKAMGGTVKTDGFRPPWPPPRVGAPTPPE